MKVAKALVNPIDPKDIDILYADKGYESESLREKITKTTTKANISQNPTPNRIMIT